MYPASPLGADWANAGEMITADSRGKKRRKL
jgi:hypothetical protein